MKIKLLFPPNYESDRPGEIPPLGMAMVYNSLKQQGHDVDQDDINAKVNHFNSTRRYFKVNLKLLENSDIILDHVSKRKHSKKLENLTKTFISFTEMSNYDVIAFSNLYFQQIFPSLLISKYVKEHYKSKILFGGLSFRLCEKYKIQEIDFVKEAMNDPTCIELTKSIASANTTMPDFDGLPLHLYQNATDKNKTFLTYQLDYGCVYKCNFCNYPSAVDHLDFMKPEKAVEEIIKLRNKYKIRHFHFGTSTINNNPKKLEAFCDLLIEKNADIQWLSFASPATLTDSLTKKMKESGCIALRLGIESGSPKMLKRMKKPFSVDQAIQVLKRNKKNGILNHITIIVGYPYETEEDRTKTKSFIKEYANYIDYILIRRFFLSRLSPIYNDPIEHNIRIISPLPPFGYTYAFDEVNGLDWESKQKQILQSYEEVMQIAYDNVWRKSALHEAPFPKILSYKVHTNLKRMKNKIPGGKYIQILGHN